VILLIAYDLHKPERDYEKVADVIKRADGGWAHPQGSVWIVDTTATPETWVKRLQAAGDANDEYLVSQLQHNWWSANMDPPIIQWLKDPRRRW
jgi:hypothetical protein